jgi:hypothetical protein
MDFLYSDIGMLRRHKMTNNRDAAREERWTHESESPLYACPEIVQKYPETKYKKKLQFSARCVPGNVYANDCRRGGT